MTYDDIRGKSEVQAARESELKNAIECFIDNNSLRDCMAMIATICYEKSTRLKDNYEDQDPSRETLRLIDNWKQAGEHITFSCVVDIEAIDNAGTDN